MSMIKPEQEHQLKIIPNSHVSIGKFKPIQTLPNAYFAHPQTIRALRKDIQIQNKNSPQSSPYQCNGCQHSLDRDFWLFCPFCGSEFTEK